MNTENNANENNIENLIEALLFYNGNPLKIKDLIKLIGCNEEDLSNGITSLEKNLSNRGIKLTKTDDTLALTTSSKASELINKIKKQELTKDLSKSALETLAIIIYRGPIKRSEIDYIRGVNSQFILRILLIRGLIDKVTNPNDERGYLYKVSVNLLNYLGINKVEIVPDYKQVNSEIDNFIESIEIKNEQ